MSKGKLYTPPIPVFRDLMDKTGTKREDIAKALGVSSVAIGQYYNGETLPSIENLIKIADYFNVSTDYLLGRTDVKTTDTTVKDICAYTGLSEYALNIITSMKKFKYYFPCLIRFIECEALRTMITNINSCIHEKENCYKEMCKQRNRIRRHIANEFLINPQYDYLDDYKYQALVTSESVFEDTMDYQEWKLQKRLLEIVNAFINRSLKKPKELEISFYDFIAECNKGDANNGKHTGETE